MPRSRIPLAALLCAVSLTACFGPSERRPGLWLSGEAAAFPRDWSFTDADKEIAIQVETPYLLPHSVTIWCASLDGALYVGARDPETKHWPGWVDRDPNVRLGIAGKIYDVRLAPLEDTTTLERLRAAYGVKYALPAPAPDAPPPSLRYWRVEPRA
jgi:hypothetical protein